VNPASSEAALVIDVPPWIDDVARGFAGLDEDVARMELVVSLSRENVQRGGGPFAAAVFSGSKLVAAGVNLVLQSGFSIAHAEIVALMRAQQAMLRAPVAPPATPQPHYLVTTTEPCCQCFGAIIWSGITRLVCGATTADAERIGFDEGPKPAAWSDVLERRGISVVQSVCRGEAVAVLDEYARRGGPIYGLRHPTAP
jgi:tRNA(Arg) A34 adenosine deaminase TadA